MAILAAMRRASIAAVCLVPVDPGVNVGVAVIHVWIDVTVIDKGVASKVRPVRSVQGASGSSVYMHSVLSIGFVNRHRRNFIRPM